jgi:zinc transport system substrate-binding protein
MRTPLILSTVAVLGLAACSGTSEETASTASPAALTVATSHYPVDFLVQRVGGGIVATETLTSPGTEPHDVELSPQQVAQVQDAAAVFYIGGFQPAVDDAVPGASGQVVDLTEGLPLREAAAHDHAGESEEEHAAHSEEGGTDPHVWLSPVLMQDMAARVAETLSALRPEDAATFDANAQALQAELSDLNDSWTQATQDCEVRTMVVSHEAFGYLADQYGFTQKGISGLSPETEPSAAALADLVRFVQDNGVTTVYTETLVDPAVAQTVAAEAGVQTATLDPLEGQPEDGDYFTAMTDNVETLSAGQSCS